MARAKSQTGKDTSDKPTGTGTQSGDDNNADAAGGPPGVNFLEVITSIEDRNDAFMGALQRTAWQQSIRAFNNQHSTQSKYRTDPYRDRSKNFRPKTRSAVRNNMATTAAALFANSDVVNVKATHDDAPIKQASAAVLQEALNYRLDRTSPRSGVPWFLMAMAAEQNAQIEGICISKQYWDYQVVEEPVDEETEVPVLDKRGKQTFDEAGNEIYTLGTKSVKKKFIIHDRPMVEVMPPENCIIDPAAPWWAPIEASSYFSARFPMTADECKTMMANPGKGNEVWLDVTDAQLTMAADSYTAKGVRNERTKGADRYANRTDENKGRSGIVWVYENFIRVAGVDYHFWSLGCTAFLSKVRTTRQAYPEQFGNRPYTMGYGSIVAHNPFPMSPVESWQQMQREMNDIVNLRLDTMKQALSPIALVKQGTVFDWKALQRRGGQNSTILVSDVEKDLKFDRAPDVASSAYAEMNYLNADFDDLAGVFSGSSVQTNRKLNETVGGMRMLSGAANAMSEYDLRVFVETWAEPTIRQVVRCIQYYESDETILAVAGARAKIERYGVDEITDKDLEEEVSVSVNCGVGAADPMQALAKLGQAMEMIAKVGPFLDKKPTVKAEEIIKEVFGKAGYNDGLRFFSFDAAEGGAPPEQQVEMMKMELEKGRQQLDGMIAKGDQETRIQVAKLQGVFHLLDSMLSQSGKASMEAQKMEAQGAAEGTRNLIDIFRERTRAGTAQQTNQATNDARLTGQREATAAAERQAAREPAAGAA